MIRAQPQDEQPTGMRSGGPTPWRHRVAGLAVLVALTCAPALAAGGHEFELRASSTQPASPTGVVLHHAYPDGADGRPKQVKRAVYTLAVEFHHDAMPACPATNDEILAGGLGACPPETRLGSGTATAITGFGPPLDPMETDVHVFHGQGEEIYVFTAAGAERPILNVARARVSGNTIVDEPTYPAGFPPPDGKSTLRRIDVTYEPAAPGYITTPNECPASGEWTSRVAIAYTDGSTDDATSATPCEAGGSKTGAPQTKLAHHPRRRTQGDRVRFTFSSRAEVARFQCRLRGGWRACASPKVLDDLRPGRYVFRVRAVAGGVADSTPARWRFKVLR